MQLECTSRQFREPTQARTKAAKSKATGTPERIAFRGAVKICITYACFLWRRSYLAEPHAVADGDGIGGPGRLEAAAGANLHHGLHVGNVGL